MWWAVDILASEYGGGPRAILEGVYFDELIPMLKKIHQRRIDNYRMQIIIQHTQKPRELLRTLESQQQRKAKSHFDPVGFEALKMAMSRSDKIMVK